MFDIDCHILTHSGTKLEWLEQCLDSLNGEMCNVFVVSGIEGDVAAGRRIGYAIGSGKYVAYVDSDDYVLPGVFSVCLDEMNAGATAVVTSERTVTVLPDGTERQDATVNKGHHLFCARRDAVNRALSIIDPSLTRIDRKLSNELRAKHLDFIGYVWRIHAGGIHNTPMHVRR